MKSNPQVSLFNINNIETIHAPRKSRWTWHAEQRSISGGSKFTEQTLLMSRNAISANPEHYIFKLFLWSMPPAPLRRPKKIFRRCATRNFLGSTPPKQTIPDRILHGIRKFIVSTIAIACKPFREQKVTKKLNKLKNCAWFIK